MCLNPIQIFNRSEKISFRGQSLIYTVPCGKCSECRKQKSSEYSLRSYIEYKDTLSKGGFVYFDTLTYNDKYLPKDYGISHFRRADIILFLKELRVYLTRAGFKVKDKIKYFITSEYGGLTHRPHYHVLFFITVSNLDVKTLWKYINKAWKFGFIDRESTAPSRVVNSQAALNYVSKYVQKDQEWQIVVDKKLYRLRKLGLEEKFIKKIKDFQPFHLQSQHFGENFVKFIDLNQTLTNGYITIPDRKYLIKNFAIPLYYKRKLFYTLVKDSEGKLHWKLNITGINYKVNQLENLITNNINKLSTTLYNLKSYNVFDTFDVKAVESLVEKYLDGRTLRDFVIYSTVFRNRLWYFKVVALPTYKDFFKLQFKEGKSVSALYSDDLAERSSYRSRLNGYRITQTRYNEFRNFDDLYNLFKAVTDYFNLQTDKETERVQSIRDRLKVILS